MKIVARLTHTYYEYGTPSWSSFYVDDNIVQRESQEGMNVTCDFTDIRPGESVAVELDGSKSNQSKLSLNQKSCPHH